MHITTIPLLVLQCTLCLTIRVPVWNHDSEVKDDVQTFAGEIEPQNAAPSGNRQQKPIPIEYFQYTAQKPQFAVDIAKFHGVQAPENHYKAYPIKPHTGVAKPELGKHQMLDKDKKKFRPFQEYVNKDEAVRHVVPSSTSYEIFHPYKLEEPALKELYQDPIMDKIRNDLLDTKDRLQKYENEAGEPDVTKGEYLEPPEETDRRKVPHRNVPAQYEIHRPQRRPVYYRPPPIHHNREHALNQKLRHPWHQNYVKVKPMHYRPVKNHLHRLRQQHAMKYDDEHNEYPQLPPPEKYSEPAEGYDIYEKGKAKFVQLRNNLDESVNKVVQQNRPASNQKLELNRDESEENSNENEDENEFVPIKNYAQVRKTETTKHLPKAAAFRDADTLEEIRNAPRLREAVKSSKAQTVYSEEGYEDAAYDHAGEQKHASDHEAHGGFLKEKEISGGKFKTPTFTANLEDGGGSEYRDKVEHGEKWKDNKKNTEEETESDDYSENEAEHSDESEKFNHKPINDNNRNKREDESEDETESKDESDDEGKDNASSEELGDKKLSKQNNTEHDVNKRETKIEVPEVNLNTTYLTEKDILQLSKLKVLPKKEVLTDKYPYYSKKLKTISKDSPLRYAENLKLIPKKSAGGTEFYDSRSKFECPEVEDDVDPIPEKLKKGGHPDEQDEEDEEEEDTKKDKADFSALESKPRLAGLGDKIDCFKNKYFGENPLDSPFFKEDIIANPEPVTVPSIEIYKLKQEKEQSPKKSIPTPAPDLAQELQEKAKIDMFTILNELYSKEYPKNPELPTISEVKALPTAVLSTQSYANPAGEAPQLTYKAIQNIENVTSAPIVLRIKRSTPFVYEPYKIIRDSQTQDSKKTTTTNNISPLIKQLQSSRVVDKVAQTKGKEQVVKRNVGARAYKDIGRGDRERNIDKDKGSKPETDQSFVDVSLDQRRGEPRYELKPVNHKSQYTPVENKKSISREEYKAQASDRNSEEIDVTENSKGTNRRSRVSTERPFFDVSKFLPHIENSENTAESSMRKVDVQKLEPQYRSDKPVESNDNDDEDEEEDDDEDEDEEYEDDRDDEHTTTTTTTTTTIIPTTKPVPRRRIKITSTTTTEPEEETTEKETTETPRLRLVTRFRNSYQTDKPKIHLKPKETSTTKRYEDDEITAPKYREKKKKSTKRTFVSDTKSYGGDDDDEEDMRKDEVDALIGVKQDIKEYMPDYEKEDSHSASHDNDEDDDNDDHDHEDEDNHDHEDHEDDDEDEDEEEEEDEEGDNEEQETKPNFTTPEPPKRTLARTTEAPPATTEARSAQLEEKPVVVRKKIEIHKELPVNRSSPHRTEFKQDIQEVEIIKEVPAKTRKKPQKNIEALDLYKDENLAKDVNKLGGVEVFKDGLDLENGPKHGGNYRIAIIPEESPTTLPSNEDTKSSKADVETSQSKTSKLVEPKDNAYSRRKSDIQRARNNRGRSAKLIELSDVTETPTTRPMHGGNFKSIYNERRRGGSRNAKLIELDDDHRDEHDHSRDMHGGNFKSYGSRGNSRPMHGGNYRNSKLVQADSSNEEKPTETKNVNKDTPKDGRRNAAAFLDSFVRAVPVLTTPPAYILDPSKRMYYYVDA